MLTKLFGSNARVKVLELFALNASSEFYLREIAQRTGLALRSVQRAVEDLTEIHILIREKRGNAVYFRLNGENPITEDLKSILLKTVGLADLILAELGAESRIDVAFIFGSVAKGEELPTSDIDIALVGDILSRRLADLVERLEQKTKREVNITPFSCEEWGERISAGDHFATTLLREPKIMLLGHTKELKTLGRANES